MNTQQQDENVNVPQEKIEAPTLNEWIDGLSEYPVTILVNPQLTSNLFAWLQDQLDCTEWATPERAEWRRDLLRLELAVATHYTNAAHACVAAGNACLFGEEEPIHVVLHRIADNMIPSLAFQQRMRSLAQQTSRCFRSVPVAQKSAVSVAIAQALNRNTNEPKSREPVKKLGRTVYGGE